MLAQTKIMNAVSKMGYFEKLRAKQSRFYRRLWQEISEIKVIDTHEHFDLNEIWKDKAGDNFKSGFTKEEKITIPQFFERSYVSIKKRGDYKSWAEELAKYAGTGYLTSWKIAMEELYGISGLITPKYLEEMEQKLNEAYKPDFEHNTYNHLEDVLKNEMHAEKSIVNIDLDQHLKLPQSICVGAAGIPSILNGINKPAINTKTNIPIMNIVYKFAIEQLKMNLDDIKTLDDYCDVTEKLLKYIRDSNNYICVKMQNAYQRPISFPEPPDDDSEIAKLYNKGFFTEEELWKFGDYMMHFILEWTSMNWRVPYQLHTGLARMYDGGSNAINLSHLLLKFPDVHFDLFHGNYPYNNLAGMLHQIYNISADLCWLPAISPLAAQRTLTELLEVGDMVSDREFHEPRLRTNLFGGDSGIVEGSYGALQLAKDVLVRSLEDLFNRGLIYENDAIEIAEDVLYRNPKRIFNL